MAIDIVDLPVNSMVIFYSYVTVYQRVFDLYTHIPWLVCLNIGDTPIPLILIISHGHGWEAHPPFSDTYGRQTNRPHPQLSHIQSLSRNHLRLPE